MTKPHDLICYLHERFGYPKNFFSDGDLSLHGRTWWYGSSSSELDSLSIPADRILRRGLKVARGESFPFKPTTFFVQRFGHLALKNTLHLSNSQANDYFSRLSIQLSEPQRKKLSRGYVFIAVSSRFVGCGSYRNEILYSDFPKRLSAEIHKR